MVVIRHRSSRLLLEQILPEVLRHSPDKSVNMSSSYSDCNADYHDQMLETETKPRSLQGA